MNIIIQKKKRGKAISRAQWCAWPVQLAILLVATDCYIAHEHKYGSIASLSEMAEQSRKKIKVETENVYTCRQATIIGCQTPPQWPSHWHRELKRSENRTASMYLFTHSTHFCLSSALLLINRVFSSSETYLKLHDERGKEYEKMAE